MDDRDADLRGSLFSRSPSLSPRNNSSQHLDQSVGALSHTAHAHQTMTTSSAGHSSASGEFPTPRHGDKKKHHKTHSITTDMDSHKPQSRSAKKPKNRMEPPVVLSPARVIHEFKKGNLTKFEATEAVIRYRINAMLPQKSDGTQVDKDGNVVISKGYNFASAKGYRGGIFARRGLTRIEREIIAYQRSTHHLIPRAAFARIVRAIAQEWYRGEGQIKFTVEALSALQTATEEEIIKIMEISTACSYHAKRITLKTEDMRLARFCRGRQEYEVFNLK